MPSIEECDNINGFLGAKVELVLCNIIFFLSSNFYYYHKTIKKTSNVGIIVTSS